MVRIRPGRIEDLDFLRDGNLALAAETEDLMLCAQTVRRGVQALFDDPSRGVYWIAEHEGTACGQLMLTYEWSDWRCAAQWWIQSVYVWPAQRRVGVFKALYEHVQRQALEDEGCAGIRLYVETENLRAQKTYEAMGMQASHYAMYEWQKKPNR